MSPAGRLDAGARRIFEQLRRSLQFGERLLALGRPRLRMMQFLHRRQQHHSRIARCRFRSGRQPVSRTRAQQDGLQRFQSGQSRITGGLQGQRLRRFNIFIQYRLQFIDAIGICGLGLAFMPVLG